MSPGISPIRGVCRPSNVSLAVALTALMGLACTRTGPDRLLYPVQGQVLLDGKPLAGALLVFHPIAATGPEEARPYAQSGADGRFSVVGGAPAGEYRVAVRDARGGEEETRSDAGGALRGRAVRPPARYGDPTTSGLRVRVAESPNDLAPFRLASGPGDSTKPPPRPVDD
jgi:hypothetical protein